MQNIGQTTAVQFGNALDPRGRANHPKPTSARAHGNQVGTVLAKDQSVWSSRNIDTSITSHTPRVASSLSFFHGLSLTLANSERAYRPRGMRNIGSLSTIS